MLTRVPMCAIHAKDLRAPHEKRSAFFMFDALVALSERRRRVSPAQLRAFRMDLTSQRRMNGERASSSIKGTGFAALVCVRNQVVAKRGYASRFRADALAEVLMGAAAGGAVGILIGPMGVAFGLIAGGIVGALASVALEYDHRFHAMHEAELDRATGVIGSNIGEARVIMPREGAVSAASAGVRSGTETSGSEGPFSNLK